MESMTQKPENEKALGSAPGLACLGPVPTVGDLLAQLQSAGWLKDFTVLIETPDGEYHKGVFIGVGHRGGEPCGKCVILSY
jgi:hypothetical protein